MFTFAKVLFFQIIDNSKSPQAQIPCIDPVSHASGNAGNK